MISNIPYDYDIVIVGGGTVGAALACALTHEQNNTLRIAIIEAVAPATKYKPSYDDKGLALSLATKHILDNIGIWKNLNHHATPIKHIHISDQYHFGFVRINANTICVPALGYVVLASRLGKAFMQYIDNSPNIDLLSPASIVDVTTSTHLAKVNIDMNGTNKVLSTKILVAADGTDSRTRKSLNIGITVKDYQQTAIVSGVSVKTPHANTAYERFTKTGPMALLPQPKQRFVLVFTVATEQLNTYLKMDKQHFLNTVTEQFGNRLGQFFALGKRKSYPLKMLIAKQQIQHRAVIIGNAAHTLHPNAAQGFNLGLRDVATLANTLLAAHSNKQDIGELSTLNDYLDARIKDQQRVINFTDRLARYFYNDHTSLIITRNIAMLAIDIIPSLKRYFTLSTIGIPSIR